MRARFALRNPGAHEIVTRDARRPSGPSFRATHCGLNAIKFNVYGPLDGGRQGDVEVEVSSQLLASSQWTSAGKERLRASEREGRASEMGCRSCPTSTQPRSYPRLHPQQPTLQPESQSPRVSAEKERRRETHTHIMGPAVVRHPDLLCVARPLASSSFASRAVTRVSGNSGDPLFC